MTDYLRVSWKATGHESTIAAHRFDPDRHAKTDKAATDNSGDPLPPKYKTTVSKEAAKKVPASKPKPESGHEADTEKES